MNADHGFQTGIGIEKWQGRLDSNQRMAGSKPAALPLGDAPVSVALCAMHGVSVSFVCEQQEVLLRSLSAL